MSRPTVNIRESQYNITSSSKRYFLENKDILVIAGGYDGIKLLKTVELFSYSGKCRHFIAPLPVETYGLLMTYTGDTLLACGGRTPHGNGGKRCWRYVRDSKIGYWLEDDRMTMRHPRWLASGTLMSDSGRFYVT